MRILRRQREKMIFPRFLHSREYASLWRRMEYCWRRGEFLFEDYEKERKHRKSSPWVKRVLRIRLDFRDEYAGTPYRQGLWSSIEIRSILLFVVVFFVHTVLGNTYNQVHNVCRWFCWRGPLAALTLTLLVEILISFITIEPWNRDCGFRADHIDVLWVRAEKKQSQQRPIYEWYSKQSKVLLRFRDRLPFSSEEDEEDDSSRPETERHLIQMSHVRPLSWIILR